MTHWWRAYDHSVDNAKLQRLPGDLFKAWYNLCCLASANAGQLPRLSDIAFKLRVSETKAGNVIETLRKLRLVDGETGAFRMHDWEEYQYKSDVSTERVKQFRERKRNVSSPVSETLEETASDCLLKRSGSVSVSSSSATTLDLEEVKVEQASGRKRKISLPPDFVPDREFPRSKGWSEERIDQQIQAFFDYARTHNRQYADWQAAWRNWIRSPYQTQENSNVRADRSNRDSGKAEFRRALDELGEFANSPDGGSGGEAIIRLLPSARRGE